MASSQTRTETQTGGVDLAAAGFPSQALMEHPFDFYAALRSDAPVYQLPDRDDLTFVVSRWEEIAFASRHTEIFSSSKPIPPGHPLRAGADDGWTEGRFGPWNMALTDPPEHKARRSLALRIATSERMRGYEPVIRKLVDELIDAFIDRGEVEFMSEFAELLPIYLITRILGLSDEDVPMFRVWGDTGDGEGYPARFLAEGRRAFLEKNARERGEYMRQALLDRLERPRNDFLTEYVQEAVARDGELDLPYLVADANVLLVAGHLTTRHMLGNTMLLLLERPEVMDQVRADRSLLRPLVDESLRLESPVQWLERRAVVDTELAGTKIPAGSMVILLWASGNRDVAHWEEAHRLLLDRPRGAKDQLAFGYGPHLCLGAPLARLEGAIAFEILLTRLRDIRLAEDAAVHGIGLHHRGPRQVRLRFQRA